MAKQEKRFPSGVEKATSVEVGNDTPVLVAVGSEIKKLPLEEFKNYVEITGTELKPIASGVLPTPTAGQVRTMKVVGVGPWTHATLPGGTISMTATQQGTLYFDASAWSLVNVQEIPRGIDGTNGTNGLNGATLSQLFNSSKVGGYAIDEVVRDAQYAEYISLSNNNTAALSEATKWRAIGVDSAILGDTLVGNKIPDRNYPSIVNIVKSTLSTNGTIGTSSDATYVVSDFVKVYKGDVITYSLYAINNTLLVALYTDAKVFVRGNAGNGSYVNGTFTVEIDGYVRFSNKVSETNIPIINIVNNNKLFVTQEEASSFVKNEKFLLSSKVITTVPTNAVAKGSVFNDNGDIWGVLASTNRLYISKNGELYDTITSELFPQPASTSHGGVSISKVGDTLNILVSLFDLTFVKNGLSNYSYNITTKVLTKNTDLTVTDNARLGTVNQVLYNGNIYATVNTIGKVVSGALSNANTNKSLYLFKLSGTTWENLGEIVPYDYTWTSKWSKPATPNSFSRSVDAIAVTNSTLVVVDGKLRVLFSTVSKTVFEIETTDLVTFTRLRALSSVCDTDSPVFLLKYKNEYLYFAQRYNNSDQYANREATVFSYDFVKAYNLVNYTKNWEIAPIIKNDSLFLYEGFGWNMSELNVHVISEVFGGRVGKFLKKDLPLDFTPDNTTNIGDYYEISLEGDYPNFTERIEKTGTPARTIVKPHLYKFERALLINEGGGFWRKELITNIVNNKKSVIFNRKATRNPFGSATFRIPSMTEDSKGRLMAVADARYCGAWDYEEMDVVFAKSYNNGISWTDFSIPLKRDPNMGWRMHDPSIVTDKNTGRIWVVAKQWEANVDPFESAYWSANREQSRLYATYSDDHGKTWVPRLDITNLKDADAWHISPGCAAGIQTSSGRLIIPTYEVFNDGSNRSGYIYLDSSDNTWKKGITAAEFGGNECQIAEDLNGELLMIQRTTTTIRRIIRLKNGVWELVDGTTLTGTNVACGLVRYLNTYVMIAPTHLTQRKDITVKYSYDLVKWHTLINISKEVTQGYSGIVCSNDNFGAIFEDVNNDVSYQSLENFRNILR